jgi:MFS family permease
MAQGWALSTALPLPVRRAWQLILLTSAASAANYAQTALSPLQEAMRTAIGLTDNQMAILQGPAIALPLAIVGIPLGLLIDRRSRALLVVIFMALNLLGSVLTALASSFLALFVARCLVGLAVPGVAMATLSMIADLYAPSQRGRALTVLAIGQVAGMSAAFALGGELLARAEPGPDAWRYAMLEISVPLLVVLVLVLGTREPVRTGIAVSEPSTRASFGELWRYRAVATPLLMGVVMVGLVDSASMIWAAPTLSRDFALRPDRVGTIMATCLLTASLLGPLIGGLLADFCQRTGGPRRTVAAIGGLALLSAPSGLFAVMPGVVSASALLTVFMTIGSAIGVSGAPVSTIVIPNELRGLYMAVTSAVSAPLSLGLAPLLVSLLSGHLGGPQMIGRALAILCFTISMLGAALFTFGRRYFPAVPEPASDE